MTRQAKTKPNAHTRPGTIGNTQGIVVPQTSPAPPGGASNPPALPETPEEKNFLERTQGGIQKQIDAAVEARGDNELAMAAGAMATALNEVFMPTALWELIPIGKAAKIAKKGAQLAGIVQKGDRVRGGTPRSRKASGQGGGYVSKQNLVETKPDEAFFWSGRSKDAAGKTRGGPEDAARIARENGGTTLETLIEERGIKMPDWDPTNPASIKAWENLSADYAAGASGKVRAVIGKDLRPGNIWETRELPALMSNPKVTRIVTIDPASGIAKRIHP